jgi:hypothetical protein
MLSSEIISEIDSTLKMLIKNAEIFQGADINQLSELEIDAFQKTQESLLHHFLFMDQALEINRNNLRVPDKRSVSYKIKEKFSRFEKLKNQIDHTIRIASKREPLFAKRQRKYFF